VAEREHVRIVLALVVDLHHNIVDKEGILVIGSGCVKLGYGSVDIRGAEDAMLINDLVFVNGTNDISSGDGLSFPDVGGSERPTDATGKAGDVHTLGHVHITRLLENVLKGTLDSIENGSHDSGSELDGKGLLLTEDGITDREAGGILVNLDGSGVSLELNDLTHKLRVSYTNELVHCSSRHTVSDD